MNKIKTKTHEGDFKIVNLEHTLGFTPVINKL